MDYIDQEEIYNQTNRGLDIFAHFFPGQKFDNPKHFFKIRSGEKTASARVSEYEGYYRITDFGDQSNVNGMKGIDFIMHNLNLPYYEALVYARDVIIKNGVFSPKKWGPEYEMREMEPTDKKGEYTFVFKTKPDETDLKAIGRYVTPETLTKYNCRVVSQYTYCSHSKKHKRDVVHIFRATPDYPIFLFEYKNFKKLYRPHEQDKQYRFLYIGEKPKYYVFGLEQILSAPNEFTDPESDNKNPVSAPDHKPNAIVKDLIRCSGESDALNLASLGFHVYWLNSETAELTYNQYKDIDDLCQNHFQVMDLDTTGSAQAIKNALTFYNLYNVELPAWLRKKTDWRGNPCKDLKDFINLAGKDLEDTTRQFNVIKKNARRVKFWEKVKEKNGFSYHINMEFFYFFLKANGFYQMDSIYHKKGGYCYVHIQGKIVHIIHPDNIRRIIKRFTKEWIQSRQIMEGVKLLNKINTSPQISEGNLETIQNIEIEFRNHSKHTEYIHFPNGSLRITPGNIELIKHSEVPNHILGSLEVNKNTISHICKHNIKLTEKPAIQVDPTPQYQELLSRLQKATTPEQRETINALISQLEEIDKYIVTINDPDFIFTQFLQDLANIHWRKERKPGEKLTEHEKNERNLLLANLLFIVGYHCQQYKDPGKPWITFLQDMRISEIGEASGRSGKSLLSKAPTYIRASFYKGGRSLEDRSAYQFFYDGFTEFHDYIEVDDLAEYADINWFYTQITGKREINPKNYAPFTLNYEDSGKMLISSNYELPNVNSSTIARMLNAGVSDYYHEATRYNDYKETVTPYTKFGRLLYDDFTEEEWIKFYNLMAYCIQMNMRFYKIQPPMLNLLKRQARRAMTQGLGKDEVFFSWANDYFIPYTDKILPKPEVSPEESGYLNTYIIKDVAYNKFCDLLTSKQKSDYRITKFKKHVEAFCEYWGYEFNPLGIDGLTDNRRIMKNIDGKTRECFYISTANIRTNGNGKTNQPIPINQSSTNPSSEEPPF